MSDDRICLCCAQPMRRTKWEFGASKLVVEGWRCKACGLNLLSTIEQQKLAKGLRDEGVVDERSTPGIQRFDVEDPPEVGSEDSGA